MSSFRTLALVVAVLSAPLTAIAAPVAIVNMDAKANGSTDNADVSNFVSLALDAGTYSITPIEDDFTALSVWNNNAGCDADGANCGKGFFWRVDISWDGGNEQLRLNSNSPLFADPEDALALAKTQVFPTFTLAANDTVRFGLFDSPIGDNRGGVSFELNSVAPIPLPATAVVLLSGLGLIGGLRARRG